MLVVTQFPVFVNPLSVILRLKRKYFRFAPRPPPMRRLAARPVSVLRTKELTFKSIDYL